MSDARKPSGHDTQIPIATADPKNPIPAISCSSASPTPGDAPHSSTLRRASEKPASLLADDTALVQPGRHARMAGSKTRQPVRFEITEGTRRSLAAWLDHPLMVGSEHLWPGRFHERRHISTRQYARLVRDWVISIGLEPSSYRTHSMRRTKVAQIYRKTGNLRALQVLLGHTKMDSTVRYLASNSKTPCLYPKRPRFEGAGRPPGTAQSCHSD